MSIDSAGQIVPELAVTNKFEPAGETFHKRDFIEYLNASTKTLDVQDDGKIILCTVTTVVTPPAVGATMGPYTLVNMGQELATGYSNCQITLTPATGDKFYGPDISATDNTSLVNTLATAKRGDLIRLVYTDTHGWTITDMIGTWA